MKGCSSVLPGYVWCCKSHRFYLATKQFPNQSPNRAGDAVLPIAPPMCPNPNSKSPPAIPVVVGFKYINAQKSTALGSLGSLASRGPWQQRIVFEWSATGAKWKEDMHWDWNWFNLSGILNPCYDKICVCLLCILYCLDGTVFRRYSMEKVIILISLSVPKLFSNWRFGRYTPMLLHSSWFWVWNLATSRFWTPLSYLIKPVNFWVWIGTAKKFCCDKNTWGVVTNACHSGWMTEPTVWNVKTSFECVKASMMWSATLCFVRWMMVGA